MDEIVCANTAFRYWRCPPQVRNLYPRLPSPEDGWRALAQAPFVTDILKTPIITTTVPGGVNYHSGLRTTIHCDDASGVDSTLETAMSFRVTNPLATLFTMARFVSPTDLVLAMYEFCGWFSVFEPTAAAEAELDKAKDAAENATTESLFDLDESQEEDIFDYIPPQQTNQIFTPKKVVKMMIDKLEEESPEDFTNPDKTFADLYMKSGLYITEIVKRLYAGLEDKIPDENERLKHILEHQVYGFAPSEIIYNIARNFIFGFDENAKNINDSHIVYLDTTSFARGEGDFEAKCDELFGGKN